MDESIGKIPSRTAGSDAPLTGTGLRNTPYWCERAHAALLHASDSTASEGAPSDTGLQPEAVEPADGVLGQSRPLRSPGSDATPPAAQCALMIVAALPKARGSPLA